MTTQTEARELAQRFGTRMCDENGDTHGEELYCLVLDDIVEMGKALAQQSNEQVEPVAWLMLNSHGEEITISESNLREKQSEHVKKLWGNATPLFAHPPVPTAQPKEPEQEPYGYLKLNTGKFFNEVEGLNPMTDKRYLPLYTHPPVPYVVEPRTAQPKEPEQEPVAWKLVPVKSTREIEDAIGNSRNLKASEIWEDALAAISTPPQPKEPEQEPVAWAIGSHIESDYVFAKETPLYTTPPPVAEPHKRTWVELTHSDIDQGLLRSDYAFNTAEAWRAGVVFAMTKLKEKNQ